MSRVFLCLEVIIFVKSRQRGFSYTISVAKFLYTGKVAQIGALFWVSINKSIYFAFIN